MDFSWYRAEREVHSLISSKWGLSGFWLYAHDTFEGASHSHSQAYAGFGGQLGLLTPMMITNEKI